MLMNLLIVISSMLVCGAMRDGVNQMSRVVHADTPIVWTSVMGFFVNKWNTRCEVAHHRIDIYDSREKGGLRKFGVLSGTVI